MSCHLLRYGSLNIALVRSERAFQMSWIRQLRPWLHLALPRFSQAGLPSLPATQNTEPWMGEFPKVPNCKLAVEPIYQGHEAWILELKITLVGTCGLATSRSLLNKACVFMQITYNRGSSKAEGKILVSPAFAVSAMTGRFSWNKSDYL